jgi:hypothetical protein
VALEDVRLTRHFACPHCKQVIRVPVIYRGTQNAVSYLGAAAISYGLGLRWVAFIAVFLVLVIILAALQAYIVKFVLPPRLIFNSRAVTTLDID